MAAIVNNSLRSKADLEEIVDYLSTQDPRLAERFVAAVEETFQDLLQQPGLGGRWETDNSKYAQLRVWRVNGFRNHLVFYEPLDDGIQIVRVLDGARDLTKLFP